MKKTLTTLTLVWGMMLSFILAEAQDKYIDVQYIGPKMIEIKNKGYTEMTVEFKADKDFLLLYNKNAYSTYDLPKGTTVFMYSGSPTEISVKASSIGYWLGELPKWITIKEELTIAPVFKSLSANMIGDSIKVEFQVEKQLNVREYNIQTSKDGKTWETKKVVKPFCLVDTTYSINIK